MITYNNVSYTKAINAVRSKDPMILVIKIGTSSICDEKTHYPLLSNLSRIVETILNLKSLGHRVVLVTSGAVGVVIICFNYAFYLIHINKLHTQGLLNLGLVEKPKSRAAIQVSASLHLKNVYESSLISV
jgi:glutamate 5-kinase